MKTNDLNDKQLNNLFEQIKKSEPLISRDESVEIVKNTNTFGVKKMINIGITMAALAALVTTGLFFPFEEENIQNDENNQVNIELKADEQTEILPVKELEDQPLDEYLLAVKEKENKSIKSKEFKRELNQKKITEKLVQINSIPVEIKTWRELGFVTSDNELRFSAFKDTPENSLIILGENDYDMEMSSDEHVKNKIYPAFVSNEKGERIISLFLNASDGLQMTKMTKPNVISSNDDEGIVIQDTKQIIVAYQNDEWTEREATEYDDLNAFKMSYRTNDAGEKEDLYYTDQDMTRLIREADYVTIFVADSTYEYTPDPSKASNTFLIDNNNIIFSTINNPDAPKRAIFLHDENNPDKTKKPIFQTHDINKLIPMSVELGKKKYILWFSPSEDFVQAIPRSLQEILRPEIEAIRREETAQCGGTDFGEEAVMDVWKGCSGAVQNMRIYPNPAKTSSNIQFDLDEKRQISITIVDLSGRVIKQISSGEFVSPGQIQRAISLENISPGMYYVKITSEIGEQALQRIIVN